MGPLECSELHVLVGHEKVGVISALDIVRALAAASITGS